LPGLLVPLLFAKDQAVIATTEKVKKLWKINKILVLME
jgi:hypothetical protein